MKKKIRFIKVVLGILLFLVVFNSCLEPKKKDNVIAQVQSAVLSLEELENNFPAEYSNLVSKEQYLDFIKRWVDEEILLYEAEKTKLHLEPDVQRKIRESRKKIIVEEYLARESTGFSFTPDESSIRQYYESNSQSLLRKEPEFKFAVIMLPTLSDAWQLRTKVEADNFFQLQALHSVGEKTVSIENLRFKRLSELDTCYSDDVLNIRVGGTSSPIACGDRYFLVKCVDKKSAGSLRAYEDVKDEISSVLINIRHKKHLEKMINDLKSEIFFSFNPNLVPGKVKSKGEIETY